MKFKNDLSRANFIERLGGAILTAMEKDQDLLSEAVYGGRIGLHEMSDGDLIGLGSECHDLHPEPGTLSIPFALPLRFDDGVLVSATGETIESFVDATADERDYILKAINSHEALVALMGAPELVMDEVEPVTAELMCAAIQALEGRA